MISINLFVLAQIIGILAIITNTIGIMMKKDHRIKWFAALSNSINSVQFALLGDASGTTSRIVASIQNGVGYKYSKHGKDAPFKKFFFAMSGLSILFTWNKFACIFLLGSTMLRSVAALQPKAKKTRMLNLLADVCNMVYGIFVGAYANVVQSAIQISVRSGAIVNYDILNNKTTVVSNEEKGKSTKEGKF